MHKYSAPQSVSTSFFRFRIGVIRLTQLAITVNIDERPDIPDLLDLLQETGDKLGLYRLKSSGTGVSFRAWVASHHVWRPLVALLSET